MTRFSGSRLLLTVVLAFCILSLGFSDDTEAGTILKEGDLITNFALPDGLTGKKVTFDDNIKNKSALIILTFINTTCSACKAEMNMLSDLSNQYGGDIKVYAIAVDINGERTIPAYDKTFGFNADYMLDPDFDIPQKFGFTFTPSLVIASGDGRIILIKGGFSEDAADEITDTIKYSLR